MSTKKLSAPVFNHTEHRKSWQYVVDTLSCYDEANIYKTPPDITDNVLNYATPEVYTLEGGLAPSISYLIDYYFIHHSSYVVLPKINPACDYAERFFLGAKGINNNQFIIKGHKFCEFCPINYEDSCGFYNSEIQQETQTCFSNLAIKCMTTYNYAIKNVIHDLRDLYKEVDQGLVDDTNLIARSDIINHFLLTIKETIGYAEQIRSMQVKSSVVTN